MTKILIKGGTLVNHDNMFEADILLENGIIKQIQNNIICSDDMHLIDASGKMIFPGGVDCDCRLLNSSDKYPVADSLVSGSLAALCGGTTTIINEVPACPGDSILQAFKTFRKVAESEMQCDFALTVSISKLSPSTITEMKILANEMKIASFSFRFSSGNQNRPFIALEETDFLEVLEQCRYLGVLPSIPASANPILLNKLCNKLYENVPSAGPEAYLWTSPEQAEANTIARVSSLANEFNFVCPILFKHIHSLAALNYLVNLRREGKFIVFGQTSIAAIGNPFAARDKGCNETNSGVLHSDWAVAAACHFDPPLRPNLNIARNLLAHLYTGDLATVGSAHRAISTGVRAAIGLYDFRRLPIGMATVSSRLSALWKCGVEKEAIMDPCSFVATMSTNAARLFNLYPKKGRLSVGSDADIVIWNPVYSSHSAVRHLPANVEDVFDGLNLFTCRPETVILRGTIIMESGILASHNIKPGCGKYLPCHPFGQFTFGRVNAAESKKLAQLKQITREPYIGPVIDINRPRDLESSPRESFYHRKEYYDNVYKETLPPGKRTIHTSVKTAQPPGGSSNSFW